MNKLKRLQKTLGERYSFEIFMNEKEIRALLERPPPHFSERTICALTAGCVRIEAACYPRGGGLSMSYDLFVKDFPVAPEGSVLLSLDFSQIELRVGAFFCRDEKMLETYRDNGDIHDQTASVIFGAASMIRTSVAPVAAAAFADSRRACV
jgi:hypothetical protein